jgi:dTDP-glucose 4,6-dehydratase
MAYHRQQGVDTGDRADLQHLRPADAPARRRAIPTFLRQALQDRPITVFGDGSQTRSFCYVDDLIDGIIRLAESGITSRSTSATRTSSRCSSWPSR